MDEIVYTSQLFLYNAYSDLCIHISKESYSLSIISMQCADAQNYIHTCIYIKIEIADSLN